MAHKICFINQKGGVGKTTLTFHSSGALAELGKKVLAIDIDAQGNLTSDFIEDIDSLPVTIADILREDDSVEINRVIRKTNFSLIDIVPANKKLGGLEGRLANVEDSQFYLIDELTNIENRYDYILIDCPPVLGKPTRIAMVAADYAIIPIECKGYAFEGSARIVSYILEAQKRANPKLKLLGFVINKYDSRRALEQGYREALKDQYNETLFKTEFKRSVKYTEASTAKQPITLYASHSEEAEAARQFVKEIMSHVEKG